jgi:ATP-binding cassette subfamily C (CFTR/MRP) protein 4
MDEIIRGVHVIKLYAWEKPFAKLIRLARKLELKIVKKASYVRALYMTFMLTTTRMCLFCTMLAIVLLGDQITAPKVFVISAYFNILSNVMSQMFVRGVAEIAEALVALRRLRKFLEYDEKPEEPKAITNGDIVEVIIPETSIKISKKNSLRRKKNWSRVNQNLMTI